MPMNAPVTRDTGTRPHADLVHLREEQADVLPAEASVSSQRNVRPQKMQKSPNAASVLLVSRPICSIIADGHGRRII